MMLGGNANAQWVRKILTQTPQPARSTISTIPEIMMSRIGNFFSSQPVVAVGTICSIVGLVTGIYFGLPGKPQLTCTAFPNRSPIVSDARSSDIKVSFKGIEVSGPVTALQIAFWNAGSQPIRSSDILKPLTVKVGNKVQILEASIQVPGRDVTGFKIDQTHAAEGLIKLDWSILEKNDGAVVQLVYNGSRLENVDVSATLVGQPVVSIVSYSETSRHYLLMCVVLLLGSAFYGVEGVKGFVRGVRKKQPWGPVEWGVIVFHALLVPGMFFVVFMMIRSLLAPSLPFKMGL